MNHYLISLIIPMYNAEQYISYTLESIIEQINTNIEVIIVDDGSTDDSVKIVSQYAEKYGFISLIEKENGGPSSARNTGIEKSNGIWLYFIDSDDFLCHGCLNVFSEIIKKYPFDMVIGGFEHITLKGKKNIKYYRDFSYKNRGEISAFIADLDTISKPITMNYLWNRIIRKELIIQNNISFAENIRLGEDFVFICDCLKYSNSIKGISSPVYRYISHDDSLVSKFDINERERRKIMLNSFNDVLDSFDISLDNRNLVFINEGGHLLSSIGKINFKTCTITNKDKVKYINSFLDSESLKYINYYLTYNMSFMNFLKIIVYNMKNPYLVYLILKVKKMRE